jgi:hypothetical protein
VILRPVITGGLPYYKKLLSGFIVSSYQQKMQEISHRGKVGGKHKPIYWRGGLTKFAYNAIS